MLTLFYPNQDGKQLYLADSFYWRYSYDTHGVRYRFHWVAGDYRHGANDIHGAYGQRLSACYAGRIVWVDEGPAFGAHQFKIVDAFGREFHYKHTLDRPPNGERVEAGNHICHLGASGLSSASAAHLHFEIRTHNDKNAVINPHEYLLAARAR